MMRIMHVPERRDHPGTLRYAALSTMYVNRSSNLAACIETIIYHDSIGARAISVYTYGSDAGDIDIDYAAEENKSGWRAETLMVLP